jgi:hypothetical protein
MGHREYVEQRNGGFYITGTRVSLDSIVCSFKSADSPEAIRQNFSSAPNYTRLERATHEVAAQDLAKR